MSRHTLVGFDPVIGGNFDGGGMDDDVIDILGSQFSMENES
ncbi:MAG: hypothetical protein ACFCU8_16730 [Thermosynechococcaceae cyanobacterium]